MTQPPPKGTVLVIDDEADIRGVLQAMLQTRGYSTLAAQDGHEGVEIYRANLAAICAVIVDLRMPGMHGGEVLQALRAINADVRVVAISGWIGASGPPAFDHRLVFVPKPMTMSELLSALDAVQSNGDGSPRRSAE